MKKLIILIFICFVSINVEAGKIHMRIGDQNSIAPYQYDMPFLLDGTIIQIGGNYYFKDRTKNNRHFLITGYDFPTGWTHGFPYKSAATISAPANDFELWAYDVDSFLYDGNHNPRQIPVISLFQNIGYVNRLFCKHESQQLDANGVETYEPRVSQIVLYRTVKTSTQLTNCNSHFGVPVKSVTHIREVAPTGKTYSTISAAMSAASTGDTIYVYRGDYNLSTSYFTFNKTVTIKTLGFVRLITTTGTYAIAISNYPTIEGVVFVTGKTYLFLSGASGANPTFKHCYSSTITTMSDPSSFAGTTLDGCVFTKATNMNGAWSATTIIKNCYLRNTTWIFDYGVSYKYNRVVNNTTTVYSTPINNNIDAGAYGVDTIFNNEFTNTAEVEGYFVLAKNRRFIVKNNHFTSTAVTHNFVHIQGFINGSVNIDNCIYDYNYNKTNSITGTCVQIGRDCSEYIGIFDNTEIKGNRIVGSFNNDPNITNNALHGILLNNGKNNIVTQNWISDCGYGLVVKSAGESYSTNGIWANLFTNNYDAIHLSGIWAINIDNNLSYNWISHPNMTYTSSYLVLSYVIPESNTYICKNNVFKNNIAYTSIPQTYGVSLDANALANGCIFENGLVYGQTNLINNYTSLATAQSAGLLLECLNQNPNLKSTTELWPTVPITSIAENLGSPYNVCLDTTTTWGSITAIPVIVTKNQPATWQIGGYVK